jgi:hypothetical protein
MLFIATLIFLFHTLFPVIASNTGIESFEAYPVGSFPTDGSYLYNLRYWFPEIADDPLIEIVDDPEHIYHGNKSVKLTIDGKGDDGTVWLLIAIPAGTIGDPSSTHTLAISGWLWSAMASDLNQWPVMASISTQEPTSNATKQEEDFTIIGWTEVKEGWTEYSLEKYNFTLPSEENAAIFFTFGISVTWETARTYWIDYLTIQVDGAVYQKPSGSSPGFEFFILVPALMVFWLLRKGKKK